jgi:hypothetical protein
VNVLAVKTARAEGLCSKGCHLLQTQMLARLIEPNKHRAIWLGQEGRDTEIFWGPDSLAKEITGCRMPSACSVCASDPKVSRIVLSNGIAEVTKLVLRRTKALQR